MGWLRATVRNVSMLPAIAPGDRLLVRTTGAPRRGEIVVVRRGAMLLVKRLVGVPGDTVGERPLAADEWWVEGDNAGPSEDSRSFGPVPRSAIAGRVVLRYHPRPGRVR